MTSHLVGAAEIAELLGVTRQRVHQLAEHPAFPPPTVVLSSGRVWERAAVEAWAKEHWEPHRRTR